MHVLVARAIPAANIRAMHQVDLLNLMLRGGGTVLIRPRRNTSLACASHGEAWYVKLIRAVEKVELMSGKQSMLWLEINRRF
jgi:hypothetical protein